MDSKLAVKQLKALGKMTKGMDIRLAAEWDESWKILIATIMSAQSRDSKTIEVCEVFFKKYDSPKKIARLPLEKVEQEIRTINYYKTKARNLKKTCEIISKEGIIGETMEELIRLPGVGRKTASVFLNEAMGLPAIAVDTHVARISQKLGWSKNSDRDKIEQDLMKLFPEKYWKDVNYNLVRFGQTFGRSAAKEDEILDKIYE